MDIISYQPEEILINIFKYLNYQPNIYYVCQRFRQIIQLIDTININYLINNHLINNVNNINFNIIQINQTLKNTFILNNIFTFYEFNIIDIKETLFDIERIHIYQLIKNIKFKYKIAVDDIKNILLFVMKFYNYKESYIARQLFVKMPNLGCMLVISNNDLLKIINYLKININNNYYQYYKIINYNGKEFSQINNSDYQIYYNQIYDNIEFINNMKTTVIFNQRIILAKRYCKFFDMIKKSKNFKIHFNAIKMID